MSTDLEPARPQNLRKKKRDEQIRRFVRHLRTIAPHVDRPELVPLLRSYAMVTLTLERAYATLKERSLISEKTEELRASVDTISRLVGQQAKCAAALGLTVAVAAKLNKTRPVDLAAAMSAEVVDAEP